MSASTSAVTTPRESKFHDTQPASPRLPPARVKEERTSDTVRLRLFGERLEHDGDAAGAVALVQRLFQFSAALASAGAALDGAIHVVLRHVVLARLLDGKAQPEVGVRVAAALAGLPRLSRGPAW